MDFTNDFANPEAEKEGVWVDYPEGSGARVKVARGGNVNFGRKHEKNKRPFLKQFRMETITEEQELAILCKSIPGTILLDWEGFTDNGKPLKYSDSNAEKMLLLLTDFRTNISNLAADGENFFVDLQEDAEKNS
tara:strand:- start:2901 stop:3302 length:402 start_codon:yes stop_codon:yes gene_type:complete